MDRRRSRPIISRSAVAGGGAERSFSTRERPWRLLGGQHGDEWVALVNGVSGGLGPPGGFIKYIHGQGAHTLPVLPHTLLVNLACKGA